MKFKITFLLVVMCFALFSQKKHSDKNTVIKGEKLGFENSILLRSPEKAALYSAIVPGLGQYYNKKYWKIPIVYAVIGIPAYFIKKENDNYRRYRDAFVTRLNGGTDEFGNVFTLEQLANIADDSEKNRNIAIVFTVLAYALNILDAAVDAHLQRFDNDSDLSFVPVIITNNNFGGSEIGVKMSYKF